MNIRGFLVIGILWLGLLSGLHAQSYHKLWSLVEELEKKDMPKSIVEAANTIYVKAEKEKNVPQMMKAFLTMTAYRNEISPDSLQVDLQKLEAWASSPQTSIQDKAVLASILGEMILSSGGEIPIEKADDWLKQSLKDSLTLADYDAGKFAPVVVPGETSVRYFDNNLYELLAKRAISLWQKNSWRSEFRESKENIQRIYQSLLNIYERKGMREAWLLTALDAFPNADKERLQGWIKEYGDLDVCAEVYLKLAESYVTSIKEDVDLLREAMARYPHYERIQALKEYENRILSPQLSVWFDVLYPNEMGMLDVSYYNLSGFSIQLYQLDLTSDSPLLSEINTDNVTKHGTLVREEHFDLKLSDDYVSKNVKLPMKIPAQGIYFLKTIPDGRADATGGRLMHVTSLQMIGRSLMEGQSEIIVLDRKSGHPVLGAKFVWYDRKGGNYYKKKEYIADAFGKVLLPEGTRDVYCEAQLDNVSSMPIVCLWLGRNRFNEASEKREKIQLFTDRSIYRPGQLVHYSGLIYTQQKDSVKVAENHSLTIGLFDANRQEIRKESVVSDSFGAFSGTFNLPEGALSGEYRIQVNGVSTTIRVEEYKRPTFEVEFEPLDSVGDVSQQMDSVCLEGWARSFFGVPVRNASVKYTVVGKICSFERGWKTEWKSMTGETITDESGRFMIPIKLESDRSVKNRLVYSYDVSADVTNMAGETQNGKRSISMGGQALWILPENWDEGELIRENKKPLKFSVFNQLQQYVNTVVNYEVYEAEKDDGGKQVKKQCVLTDKSVSNQLFMPENIYALPSGEYILKVMVKGQGEDVESEWPFMLLSLAEGKLPYQMGCWTYQTDRTFIEDRPVTIYMGSSEKDVYLFYDVFGNGKHLERKNLVFSDSLMAFRFSYKEEYGDGVEVRFAFLKDGSLYQERMTIVKPEPEKKLVLTWKTFRDKLRPGAKEKWTLNVLHKDGTPADAQLMAGMYDASLDQFLSHHWNFGLSFERKIPSIHWETKNGGRYYWSADFPLERLDVAKWKYSYLDIPDVLSDKGMMLFTSVESYSTGRVMKNMAYAKALDSVELEEEVKEGQGGIVMMNNENRMKFRTNFAETAFFYPQLRTNSKGEVEIEFTLPESLTTWRFMGLAHTKDMDYGDLSANITASKDFMLQPNLPRFVRVGDDVTFTASLMNLTEKEIRGTVRMELFNPETEKVWMKQKESFHVVGKGTQTVQFSFKVKDEYEVLACRMIAEGGKFSDGEQRYIPILTDKQWMTESVSIDVDKAGTYRIPLEDLFNHHSNTVTHSRMVVEFTGNPAWYVVQALPVLVEPDNDNAFSWASAFYANTLAEYIAVSNPKIRQVVDSWKGQKDVLSSPLQKNEELKGLLLEETPWLSEGLDETTQRQRLVSLFEANALNYRNAKVINKLKELQNTDGAWSWYKGMPGNRYMTTQIVELLARLQVMTPNANRNQEMVAMYKKAFGYLKKLAHEEYERMKDTENDRESGYFPSEQTLRYLYICALDKTLQPEKEINDAFIRKLEMQSAQLTIYGKSLVSIILHCAGRLEKADEFLQSVMEYSVETKEMGRYFDTRKASYSWFSYKIPTEVIALEAFVRLRKDEKTVEQMKRWLLKQKQTQVWDMPIATVDAIYALMMNGGGWLEHAPSAKLVLGKETLQLPEQHALGYLKQEVEGKVMSIEDIVIHKETDGMAWGAVYAQFFEKMDKVEAYSNSLSVSRTLLKDGTTVSPDVLEVGDRITVCLTISVDRDMDFVQLKDERASCMEPMDVLSSYRWNNGIGYYQVTKDASTLFFFDQLRKGTHVLEYDVFITAEGIYQQGTASIQSVYAPEFGGHSATQRMNVK